MSRFAAVLAMRRRFALVKADNFRRVVGEKRHVIGQEICCTGKILILTVDVIKMDEEVFEYVDTFIKGVDTGLYGPKTFAMMESHWPGVLKDAKAVGHQKGHAKWYAEAEKVVFSRTLKSLANPQAKLVNNDLPGAVKALKGRPGKNIMIFGSPGLVHSFAKLGLIDEFVISISPIALGSGTPLFKGFDGRLSLELVDTKKFACGSIGCHYRRV